MRAGNEHSAALVKTEGKVESGARTGEDQKNGNL